MGNTTSLIQPLEIRLNCLSPGPLALAEMYEILRYGTQDEKDLLFKNAYQQAPKDNFDTLTLRNTSTITTILGFFYLKNQEGIRMLHAEGNFILFHLLSDLQCQIIFEIIINSPQYTSLGLKNASLDELSDTSWEAFCIMLASAHHIHRVNLSGNNLHKISEPRKEALLESLRKSHIKELEINDNLQQEKEFNDALPLKISRQRATNIHHLTRLLLIGSKPSLGNGSKDSETKPASVVRKGGAG